MLRLLHAVLTRQFVRQSAATSSTKLQRVSMVGRTITRSGTASSSGGNYGDIPSGTKAEKVYHEQMKLKFDCNACGFIEMLDSPSAKTVGSFFNNVLLQLQTILNNKTVSKKDLERALRYIVYHCGFKDIKVEASSIADEDKTDQQSSVLASSPSLILFNKKSASTLILDLKWLRPGTLNLTDKRVEKLSDSDLKKLKIGKRNYGALTVADFVETARTQAAGHLKVESQRREDPGRIYCFIAVGFGESGFYVEQV